MSEYSDLLLCAQSAAHGSEWVNKELILTLLFSSFFLARYPRQYDWNTVIEPLNVSSRVSSSNGRVFRPKECDRLILYLKDLNLANPDKYGTCMLIAFLQQILTYGGFYDNLEWVGLEAVTIVSTMTAGTGLGRHLLNTRFTSVMRIISINEPDKVRI